MGRIITGSRSFWNRHDLIQILVLAGMSIAGMILIIYATDVGPWAYSDSAAYLTTARNIATGRGIVLQDSNGIYSLLPLHAPLYPLAVSLPVALGADPLQASRWLNAILFGLTVFLAGWGTYHFSRSFWLSVSVAALIMLGYEPIQAYSGAMSEGLFIFFGFFSLVLIALAIEKTGQNELLLIGAGATAGLAILARYTGLAVLAAGGLAVFILPQNRILQRLKSLLFYLLPGIFLAALWFVPVYLTSHTFGSRPLGSVEGVIGKVELYFNAFMDVIGGWLPFYYRGNHIITPTQKIILAWVVLAGLIFFTWKKRQKPGVAKEPSRSLVFWIVVLVLFCAAYIALHLAAFVTASTQPDVNGRLLLPLYIGGVLLAASAAGYISNIFSRKWIGGLIFVLLSVVTLWYFHGQVQNYIFEMHNFGFGYSSKRWQGNNLFKEIDGLDSAVPLYSNNPALVLFYTERFPKTLGVDVSQGQYEIQDGRDSALILFNDIGESNLSGEYARYVESLRQNYVTVFENGQGLILIPRTEN